MVFEGGLPVEVRIRTELLDLWAQVFERLADRWGRAIRYEGELYEPDAVALDGDPPITRRQVVGYLQRFSDLIDGVERAGVDVLEVEDDLARYADDRDESEYQALAADRAEHGARLAEFEERMRRTPRVFVLYATGEGRR